MNDVESRKHSRMLDLSQMSEVKPQEESEGFQKIWHDFANAMWKEPKERIEELKKQEDNPFKES